MEKLEAIKIFFKENLVRFIISFIVVIIITVVYNLVYNGWKTIVAYIDSTFISGVVLLCVSGLSFVGNQGTYDIFSYSFGKIFKKVKEANYYDYVDHKNLERKKKVLSPLSYLFVGLFVIIISLVLLFISRAIYL